MALKILDSNQAIAQRVRRALKEAVDLNEEFLKRTEKIIDFIANFLYEQFTNSPTYVSLTNGTLRAEFGLDDEEVGKLPDIIIDMLTIKSDLDFTGGKIKLIIKFIDETFDPNKYGSYTSVNKRGEATLIPWLYWLLTAGTDDVVVDYHVVPILGAGRSEMAIMMKEEGSSYYVEHIYSGTYEHNWITRTIRDSFPEIRAQIIGILTNGS